MKTLPKLLAEWKTLNRDIQDMKKLLTHTDQTLFAGSYSAIEETLKDMKIKRAILNHLLHDYLN